MRRAALYVALLAAALALVWWPRRPPEPPPAPAPDPVDAVLARYCLDCHGPASPDGDLTGLRDAGFDALHKSLAKLHTREMPPTDRPQPAPAERDALTAWIEARLATLAYDGPPDPGHVAIRRLTREQYRRTIRDLAGLDVDVDLPPDNVGYGFDAVGDVQSLPPMLLEKYLAAAESIIERATLKPPSLRRFEAAELDETVPTSVSGNQRVLYTNAELYTHERLPAGEYVLRAMAEADQAGPDPARLELTLDGRPVERFDVTVGRGEARAYEVHLTIEAGRRRLGAAFVNDYWRPEEKNPKDRDRNLVIEYLEIEGPFLPHDPAREAAHARVSDLRRFAERAYRRPIGDDEWARLEKLGDAAPVAVLVSPYFLFRPEGVGELNDFELATRLSYFLWSSMPDDELFEAARRGDLDVEAQAMRMLRDPKASALAEDFAPQWLQIRRLEAARPDAALFPSFDEPLRAAMRREVELFFDAIVREDRPVADLLDADFTFVNERLARHYGIEGVTEWRRLQVPHRGGVLTMGAVLTATSDPARTSAVRRGKWVLDVILDAPPPPPLPDAGTLEARGGDAPTMRLRLERHRADPNCATCHQRMDPIGFGFENYDAIGAWRDREGDAPVDASAVLPDGRAFDGPAALRALLDRAAFKRCLVKKLMVYALGRGIEFADGPAIDAVVSGDDRFSALVRGIVTSYPFRHRR